MLFSPKRRPRIEDPDLWARIEGHAFDDRPGDIGFRERLAADTGWTPDTVEDAIEEYRRFAYLWATAAHPVTPSIAVDIVWHLHLAYTRNYWDHFCRHALGRPMHHEPTAGGEEDRARFRQQYAATLETYEHTFGERPPTRYWPDPDRRFAPAAQPRLYSPATHTLLGKGVAGSLFPAAIGSGVFGVAMAMGWPAFTFFGGGVAVLFAISLVFQLVAGARRGGGAMTGSGEVGVSIGNVSADGDGDGDGGGCGGD